MRGKYQQNVEKNIEKISLLNKRIKELTEEKDNFLELASHELKSPLRKITSFADMLENKFSADIPTDALRYLERIRKNITAMQSIIDGITQLNSITRGESNNNCDLNEVLAESLRKLSASIIETNAIIQGCELPVIEADFMNMENLFNNLLSNSIKFRKPAETPQVDISCCELAGDEKNNFNLPFEKTFYKIKFADNSMGFSGQHAAAIFEPFVQLNGKSEFDGNGLGLSICRKIVEVQGGIIYAESNPTGSSFTLILPKLADNADSAEN
jgi:light-regulated signal transduction histidine kinase (bacteriophytochrome)